MCIIPIPTVSKIFFVFQGIILMGPLLVIDPDMATPIKKWLARVLQGILPSFSLGALEASHITRDAVYVKKVNRITIAFVILNLTRLEVVYIDGSRAVGRVSLNYSFTRSK